MAQHNFPHGVVSFCDGLVHDPLRHKANFLKLLISEVGPRVEGSGVGVGAPNPASVLLSLGFTRLALQYLKETRTVEQDGP